MIFWLGSQHSYCSLVQNQKLNVFRVLSGYVVVYKKQWSSLPDHTTIWTLGHGCMQPQSEYSSKTEKRKQQFSLFLVARSGKLGRKTVCPNVSEYQNSMCKVKGQRYIASVCHIISLIEFRKLFTQSKCINCIGIQNINILKKLFHASIQTVILKLVMLNYG